ncbi:MAG: hypothetical protein ACYC9L_02870 [Sulfuricaulis sp.]
MAAKKRVWKKDPPDGTNYSYWVSSDGFIIETKRRFLPAIGYSVYVPRGTPQTEGLWSVRFDTLGLAKAAVEKWSMAEWIRAGRQREADWRQILQRTQAEANR